MMYWQYHVAHAERALLVMLLATLLLTTSRVHADSDVTLSLNGHAAVPGVCKPADITSLVMDNGLLKIAFGKDANGDFSATSVIKNGQELAHNLHGVEPRDVDAHRTFYLDSNAGKGHLVTDAVVVISNTPQLAHFAVVDNRALHLEHHFVMLKGESGVHPYVIIKTAPGASGGGEMRTMYRFDMDILDFAWTNERTGHQPKYKLLQSISEKGNLGDETWRLADGSVYQKYDYSIYYSQSPMWGHYGHGFGVFFIPTSTESYAGGPLRQELAVHQDALILNYLGGGHYAGGGTAAGRNGEKIHGPWYLYFSSGDSAQAIIDDALKTAAAERAKWPYNWVDEALYPIKRTTVTGQIHLSHDRSAAHAYVILGQPGDAQHTGRNRGGGSGGNGVMDRASALYTQAGDYIFYTRADENGRFTLPAVRPGTYTLYAWQTQGPITQSLAKDDITINGDTMDLAKIEWDAPYHPNLLWQIGQADRMAGEFKLANLPRTNQLIYQVPDELTFTIGKSKESEDWYYAQHGGTWNVNFNLSKTYAGNLYLTIAIAGGVGNMQVVMNGTELGTLEYGDDASVRRAANRSGRYGRNEFTFPANLLKQGGNTLSLQSRAPGGSGGLMYDTIVLEAD